MATIELGDVADGRPLDAAADRLRPRIDRSRVRLGGLVVAAVALLCCGAAAPVTEPGVRQLWSGPLQNDHTIDVTADTLFVQGPDKLVAHDLAGGRVRWTWRSDEYLVGYSSVPAGGPVLVTVGRSEPLDDPPSVVTIALDPMTGAEKWRQPGTVRWTAEAGSALLAGPERDGAPARLSRIRLTDGQPLWTRPAPGMQEVGLDGRNDRLVFSTVRGDVTVLRFTDGARLAGRRFDGVAPDPAGVVHVSIAVDGGRLLMFHNESAVSYSTVHDMSTLREVYRTRTEEGPVSGCGVVLCRFDVDRFTAVDPVTGRPRWRESPVVGLSLVTDDRVLLDTTDGREHVLADSRTGRALASKLRGVAVLDRVAPDSFLLIRRTTDPAGWNAVSRVDLATGATTVLGRMPAAPDPQSCLTVPGHLVCPGATRFAVTAVPR